MKIENNTPSLRFQGFEGEWKDRKLGEICDSYSGGTPSVKFKDYYTGNIPFIRSGEINSITTELSINEEALKDSSAKLVDVGDILYALYGATSGEVGRAKIKGAINQAILAILPHSGYDSEYLAQWLRRNKENIIDTYLQGGQGNLSGALVKELMVSVPSFDEQREIGKLFLQLDRLLSLQQQKLGKLEVFKKAMLDKMFPQKDSKVPEIRFRGFTEPWEEIKLGEIAHKVSEKNVDLEYLETFTNSAEFGMISQSAFFDNAISKIASLGGYYIVRPQDFVYNPRISAKAPVGPINCNKLGRTGVMSPLYTVFRIENIDTTYLEFFFKSSVWHPFMYYNGDSGARSDRFSIKDQIFFEMPILLPSVHEQRKIGQYFAQLDRLISLQELKVAKLQGLKKALLESMFPPA